MFLNLLVYYLKPRGLLTAAATASYDSQSHCAKLLIIPWLDLQLLDYPSPSYSHRITKKTRKSITSRPCDTRLTNFLLLHQLHTKSWGQPQQFVNKCLRSSISWTCNQHSQMQCGTQISWYWRRSAVGRWRRRGFINILRSCQITATTRHALPGLVCISFAQLRICWASNAYYLVSMEVPSVRNTCTFPQCFCSKTFSCKMLFKSSVLLYCFKQIASFIGIDLKSDVR